ncbi:lysoplasmalogenase family protein [Tamlana sp. I1]|uniref:lysoplasmalogenase family protein n=1 Tax=Tamlana sp. I1 TaxID=2762061 RepID=UPI001890912A|nr:lysoplasmalogenase family protein [Tamlana sp. I1]
MLRIFKDKKKFAILFFIVLLIDIMVKIYCPVVPYRYISKPPVLILLILYYYFNNKALYKSNFSWVMLSLFCFLVGDILVITHTNIYFLGASLVFYTFAKLFISFRFSHKSDFNVGRLIPFSIVIFIYTVILISYVYDTLGNFFVPIIISYFISLLLCQFTYLRKGVVDRKSYLSAFYGMVIYMLSEGIMVIKTFKADVPLQDFCIMFFYGTGVYLIVNGIIIEKRIEPKTVF